MFCPNCGKAEQVPESYCRQCGFRLPDLEKLVKKEQPPEEHLKVNTLLSGMTIATSFTLAILLYAILGFRPTTHPLVYVTAGLLLAMGGWHIQSLIRTVTLKKQWKRRAPLNQLEAEMRVTDRTVKPATTARSLPEADFTDAIPASVTESTTRHLVERPGKSHLDD